MPLFYRHVKRELERIPTEAPPPTAQVSGRPAIPPGRSPHRRPPRPGDGPV